MANTEVSKQIKYLNPGNLDAIRGPYPTVESACNAIPNVVIDGHNFREGKIVDIGIESNTKEFRWQGGFSDSNLQIITSLTDVGKNKIDKLTLSGKLWGTTGTWVENANYISTPLINISANADWTFSGGKTMSAATTRAVFFTSDGAFISALSGNGLAAQSFTKPANAHYIGLNVANQVGIGTNPTENAYAESVMLTEGIGGDLTYEAYTTGLSQARVIGLDDYKKTLAPIVSSIITGKNIADKTTLKGKSWTATGLWLDNVNFISLPLIKIAIEKAVITVSGTKAASSAVVRAVFFDSNNVLISAVMGNGFAVQTILMPANAYYIGLNVANEASIGTNPTENAYAESVMVEYGSTQTAYQSFKIGVNAGFVIGVPDESLPEDAFTPVKNKVDYLMSGLVPYSRFGNTSKITLTGTYTLTAVGDYVEFESRTGLGTTNSDWLGMVGTPGSSTNVFGYYTSNSMWLRQSAGGTYIQFNSLPDLTKFNKIKLEVIAGSKWQLSVGGTIVGSADKTSDLLINTIGAAYNATPYSKFDLKTFKIHTSVADLDIQDPSLYSGATNVTLTYYNPTTSDAGTSVDSLSSLYVSYNPTGYLGREVWTVYQRRSKTNYYTGYEVAHLYDMSELIYTDLYRLFRAYEYTFTNGVMVPTGEQAIIAGENECVYQQVKRTTDLYEKADFTGGYHGNEIFSIADFYINGSQVTNLYAALNLIPCETFRYVQISNMLEAANVINGVNTPVSGHPIQANHIKSTTFENGGYKTINDLDFRQNFRMFLYAGISCIAKMQATKGYNERHAKADFTGSLNVYLQNIGLKEINYFNPTNGYAASVTSTLIKPSIQDSLCQVFVHDRTTDSKYYLQSPTLDVVIGDQWQSKMTVTLTKATL